MMVLYHLPTLRPEMPQAEAISQEISMLREHFAGDVVHVNPNQQSPVHIPRFLFGFHKLRRIRSQEGSLQLHHVYNPDPYPFPYLRMLRRPLIYSLTCGVGDKQPSRSFFASIEAIAVYDERSLKRLESWGWDNVALVRPGIDTGRFSRSPLPLHSEVILMVGSAPWVKSQFRTKGVDALLSTAKHEPRLRLVFLWRGVLADEMKRRVHRMDLDDQVKVLDRLVDVNSVLAGVHASITLATSPGIVKSYPHSLLESLAAGKPVLVSRAIPMADYVEQTDCGRVVDSVRPAEIAAAIESLISDYARLRKSAEEVGHRDFSRNRLVDSSRDVYERILGHQLSG